MTASLTALWEKGAVTVKIILGYIVLACVGPRPCRPTHLGVNSLFSGLYLKLTLNTLKAPFVTIATASSHTYTDQRTIDLTSRSTLHALPSYQCCEKKNTFKVPPNTEKILITPYGLFCVSIRHNYEKFRLHGLQPSCQGTMPQASLTCEMTFHNNVLLIIRLHKY